MNEARFSTTIKFLAAGFDEQLTVRTDTTLEDHLVAVQKARQALAALGAKTTKPGPTSDQPPKKAQVPAPTCKHCGSADHMELVPFTKNGAPKQAWKCQACAKWHYP